MVRFSRNSENLTAFKLSVEIFSLLSRPFSREKGESLFLWTQGELMWLEKFECLDNLREILQLQPDLLSRPLYSRPNNMGNSNKDTKDTTRGDLTSPWDAHQAVHNLSWEREAWHATLASKWPKQ